MTSDQRDYTHFSDALRPARRSSVTKRQAHQDFDAGGGAIAAATVQDQLVLRQTPAGKLRATVTFYQSGGRPFESFTVQTWSGNSKPEHAFALNTEECRKFLEFIDRIKRTDLDGAQNLRAFKQRNNPNKTVLIDSEIDMRLIEAAAKNGPEGAEQVSRIAEENSHRDLKAVAYRRSQLERFERLLEERGFLDDQQKLFGGPEKVWQAFFEKNPWIFGYGLSYMPLAKLSKKRLEQYLTGRGLGDVGKEADALMRSNALISGLAVVEIKSPYELQLLDRRTKRAGVYHPSRELTEAVAQVQVSVQMAVERFGHSHRPEDEQGYKTGDEVHFVLPRTYLVAGHLGQFKNADQTNVHMYRSFETFRRNLNSPEIFTFDELYARARHIVEYEPPTEEDNT